MSKNSGYVFITDKGERAYSLHREQTQEFINLKKVYVHIWRDGKEVKTLKDMDKLTFIGFQN